MPKKVVVGVCTYNNEDTIEDTLEIMLNQTVKPNLFVICDKSTDRTPEILEEFKQKADFEVQILKQKGVGVGDASQDIYEYVKSRGGYDILAIFETDQGFAKNWLETHLSLREKFEECDLVSMSSPGGTYVARSLKDNYCWGGDMSINMDALDRVGGWDRNFLRGQDWDLHIRLGTSAVTPVVASIRSHWTLPTSRERFTLGKAKINPSSLSFLAKYGLWYLHFHPAHCISDLFSVLFWVIIPILFPLGLFLMNSRLIILNAIMITTMLIAYYIYSVLDNYPYSDALKKWVLHGISIPYAIKRLISRKHDWNLKGFTRKHDWNLESCKERRNDTLK